MTANELVNKMISNLPQEDNQIITNAAKLFYNYVVSGMSLEQKMKVVDNALIFSICGLMFYYIHQYGLPEDLDEIYSCDKPLNIP